MKKARLSLGTMPSLERDDFRRILKLFLWVEAYLARTSHEFVYVFLAQVENFLFLYFHVRRLRGVSRMIR